FLKKLYNGSQNPKWFDWLAMLVNFAFNSSFLALRQKINQELGYRNFNQFVNHYRIEEAGERLRKDSRTPVLSVALDVGFRSISSFNTAFQSEFGVSPTKYRAEILTES
ncbi:MAG: helix-turn-helix domain-containing protein, partial [Pseudomonadota bacterium]